MRAPDPTDPGEPESEADRRARLVLATALAVGIAFRVFQYAAGRSLWLDEVALAAALLSRSFFGVVQPGPWHAVPPGFQLLSKTATILLGTSEYALRFIPLVAGILALVLFGLVVRRCLDPVGAAVATALFAVASYPIYYAAELKQYSTDLFFAVALLLWALRLREQPITIRRAAAFAVAGSLCALFSFTSVFVLGGIGLSLGFAALRQRRWSEARTLAAVAAFWVLTIALPGLFLHRRIAGAGGGYLESFWRDGFPPLPPGSVQEALWVPRVLIRLFREPAGMLEAWDGWLNYAQSAGGLLAALLGAFFLWRRDRVLAGFALFPVALALLASAVRIYPFGGGAATSGRVLLFLLPMLFMLIAEGVARLWGRRGTLRVLAVLLLLGAAGPSLAEDLRRIPYGRTEIRPLLGYLEENLRPGDVVYVHYDVVPAFRYYRGRYRLAGADVRLGRCARLQPREYLDALNGLRGRPRVWVLFGGGVGAYGFMESRLMGDFLEHFGTRLDDRVAVGTSLFLYDLREKSSPARRYHVRIPEFPPGSVDDCPFFQGI